MSNIVFRFKGKPKNNITDDSYLATSKFYKKGFYEGCLIQDGRYSYLVNGVVDCTEEYIAIEEWCPVDPNTVELIKEKSKITDLEFSPLEKARKAVEMHNKYKKNRGF